MPGCFVPGCKSGYRKGDGRHLFRPKQNCLSEWSIKIARSDRPLTMKDRVCDLHFSDNMLIKVDTFNIDGKSVELVRTKWKLSENAVPHHLPGVPGFEPRERMAPVNRNPPTKEIKAAKGTEGSLTTNIVFNCDNSPSPNKMKSILGQTKQSASSAPLQGAMEQEVEIKEEPVWGEGTASENVEPASETIPLKQETASVLTEPGPTQENTLEASADIKEEIFVEEHQVVPNIKEENDEKNVGELTVHKGEREHRCKECNKTFTQKSSLRIHMLRHSGGTQYCCSQCNKAYTRKSSLRIHLLTHSGKRPHQCNECKRMFTQTSHLRSHMLTHSGQRAYRCNKCNGTFIRRNELRIHMLTHAGGKSHSCKQCNAAFTHKSTLVNHMLTHSQERLYPCSECKNSYKMRSSLRRHLVTHSIERYQCDRQKPHALSLKE